MICELEDKVFNVQQHGFEQLALELFQLQASENQLYRSFIQALKIDPLNINNVASIPFLPVSFFKKS